MNKKLTSILISLFIIGLLYTQVGFYTIQPLGAIPKGVTLLVWRNSGEDFF